MPTDPTFVIAGLTVHYKDVIVEGMVKEKEAVKAEYKVAKEQGETVMMGSYSKSEPSVMKIRIGNIEPGEQVKLVFTMIGELSAELPYEWTLRIPSHIGPRYRSLQSKMEKAFKNLLSGKVDAANT